jgi:hypothetical protein
MNGTKIQKLEYLNITVKDSLSFIPLRLKQFPPTFEINENKTIKEN